jgi:hypothetical protein
VNSHIEVADYVKGPFVKEYLARYGWWAQRVVDRFAFLQDLGYALDEVHFHQEGNFVRYRSPRWDFYVTYESDTDIRAGFFARDTPKAVNLDELLGARPADLTNRAAVLAKIDEWAEAMPEAIRKIEIYPDSH